MSTESKCKVALEAVRGSLSEQEYRNCNDYISKYGEWLVGLEFAIDSLVEEERKINSKSYELFKEAFILMEQESNSRLEDLRALVDEE